MKTALLAFLLAGCSPALIWRDAPPEPECPGRVYKCEGSRIKPRCECFPNRKIEDFL